MNDFPDKTFEAFRKLVPYLRGALWWARNDLLKERQRTFNQKDQHLGHPVLSVRKKPVEDRFGVVPMLMGTTGESLRMAAKTNCVKVTGMTGADANHETFFGSIVEPGNYQIADLLDGVAPKKDIEPVSDKKQRMITLIKEPWYENRVMYPNWGKPMVNADEMADLESFCANHKL